MWSCFITSETEDERTQTVGLLICFFDDWERDWSEKDLPEGFDSVLARMGEALHDTVSSPDVARDFGCFPSNCSNVLNVSRRNDSAGNHTDSWRTLSATRTLESEGSAKVRVADRSAHFRVSVDLAQLS